MGPCDQVLYEGAVDGASVLLQQFEGLSAKEQPSVKFRPPDMGLCVGNGIVLEATNLVCPLHCAVLSSIWFGLAWFLQE